MIPNTSGLWKGTVFFVMLLAGCAAPLSQQARSRVTYTGGFSAVAAEPEKFIGKTVLLGGKIIDSTASSTRSELIVLQLPPDQSGRPLDEDRSEGRFIIRSERFLDPEIFKKGVILTMVGTLTGVDTRAVGQFAYTYPVFQEVEVKVQPKSHQPRPVFHFGIGVGTTF